MLRRLFLFAAVLGLTAGVSLAQPNQVYSHGDPTPHEQYMLELINRARATPAEEGVRLMDTDDQSVQQSYTYWQIDKAKTKQAFTKYPQRPPLVFHPSLLQAARAHTADMVANNFQGHVGSNGSTLDQRYAAVSYSSMGQWGENVSAYSNSVWYGHCGLNVDWGTQNQIDLGHRSNIMNFTGAVYIEIGIGITQTSGGLQQGTVGPYVITQDFGIRNVRYITGVVFDDKNGNNFYDVGEGLSGVRVEPSRGTYYAVTSTSGGYAIPFTGSGSVTVTASGGPLTSPIVQTTSFGSDNIKVDFIPAAQKPGTIALLVPANKASVDRKSVTFDWNTTTFAEEYEIQVATDQNFTPSSIVFTSRKSTTGAMTDVPECGKTYYWRVRAHNGIGAGNWSAVYSFSTTGKAPSSPTIAGPKGAVSVDFDKAQLFTWSAVVGATTYHVRMSTQANMTTPFFEDTAVVTNELSVPASAFPKSGSFYWTVRSGSVCGWSIWSSSSQVTTTLTDVVEVSDPSFAVSVVPNPYDGSGYVRIHAANSGPVAMTIIDHLGRVVVSTTLNTELGVADHEIGAMNVLPAGPYSIVVTANGTRATSRFIKR